MPVHDWTRVDDGIFHDFHVAWIGTMRHALNGGLLPPDYYALAEQIAGHVGPDVLTLQAPVAADVTTGAATGTLVVSATPPQVQLTIQASTADYVRKRRTIAIRHRSGHRVVALIELVSPGNKASRHAIRSFLNKALDALDQGIHLLLIDLHPPTPRDPHGIHAALWEQLTGEVNSPADRPLTLAAYSAGPVKTAYVQPVAVGDPLAEMPLFLTEEEYVNVPLEPTYLAAYEGVPRFYKNILEG